LSVKCPTLIKKLTNFETFLIIFKNIF
jgi:hypothetical protein